MARSPTPVINPTMGPVEWALLLTLGVIWGSSFLFIKIAVGELPSFTVVFLRVALGGLLMVGVLRASGYALPRDPRHWRGLIGFGILSNVIPFSLLFWGQQQITAGLASILVAMTPVFTVLLAQGLTTNEKLTPARLAGVLAGVVGVAVMIGPGALSGGNTNMLAQLAVLAASFSYACAGLWGRRLSDLPPLATVTGQLLTATAMMLPITLLIDRPWELAWPSGRVVGAVIGLAALCTAFGYILYFMILHRAGATNVSLVTILSPPSTLILGALILSEPLRPRDLLGLAGIALGLALIDGRPLRWLRHHRPLFRQQPAGD